MILVCAVRMGGFVGDVRAGCFASCSESPHGAHASEDSRESQAPCESAWSIRAARPPCWCSVGSGLAVACARAVGARRCGVSLDSTPVECPVVCSVLSCRVPLADPERKADDKKRKEDQLPSLSSSSCLLLACTRYAHRD